MIQMFLASSTTASATRNQLAGGIGKALVCTAAGMIVAIPALIFHRYFRCARRTATSSTWSTRRSALMDTLDDDQRHAAPAGRADAESADPSHAHPRRHDEDAHRRSTSSR